MPDGSRLDKWPHLKQLMRRYTTRHRIAPLDNIETEEDQIKRRRRSASPGHSMGSAATQYQRQMDEFRERVMKYNDYEQMMNDATISASLDIYADEATQKETLTGYAFNVEGDDQETVEEIEKLIHQILRLDTRAWDIIRRTCAMGDNPYEIQFRKDFKGVYDITRINPKRFDRIEEDGKLIGFRIRPINFTQENGVVGGGGSNILGGSFALSSIASKDKVETISPFRAVHFMIPNSSESIYGRSILEAARRTWRQVRLMEDSVVIYRISRGAERRVFYLNTGHLADDEIEGYIRNTMAKFRKKPFIHPHTKDIDEKANPLAWDEDFYIPIQSDKDNSRIEQLPGGQNMGDIEDLRYFKNLIDSELKVPTSYLNRDGQFDSKAGLSQQDIRYSRTIERIQGHVLEGVMKVCMIHLLLRGYSYRQITSFTINMVPPSALAELLRLDALSARMEAAGVAKGLDLLPDIYIMTEILGIGEDEANQLLQIINQQRQMAAEAEATAAGGPGGGIGGGMGGLGDLAGEGPEEEGADLGEEGESPDMGEEGPEGGLEVSHVIPRGKIIVESTRTRRNVLTEWIESRKLHKDTVLSKKRRALCMENYLQKGELGGLKITVGGEQTITEGFSEKLRRVDQMILEYDTLVANEVDKLITESSRG